MASIFESPLFWIIVVWFLLTTLLGGKARRRRAAQAAPPDQPPAPFGVGRPEGESAVSPLGKRPAEIEVEAEVLEAQPLTSAPEPKEYPDRPLPTPPTRPVSPLESLFRGLGITEDMVPAALRPDKEAFLSEEAEAAFAREPEVSPEEEYTEPPPEPPLVKAHPARPKEYIPAPTRRHYPLLAETTLARLTPLQRAMVLKEVLDRPRAQRRAIR